MTLFNRISQGKEKKKRMDRLRNHSKKVIIESKDIVERVIGRVEPKRVAPRGEQLWIRFKRHPLRHRKPREMYAR